MGSRPSRPPSSRAPSAPRPSPATGGSRAFAAAGDGTRQQVVLETRDRTDSHAVDVFGMAAVEFGAGSNDLAFVAPAEPGRDVALPVGPLRLMDGASGRVRTLLDGTVLAFFWAPDGKTIAAIGVPAPGDDKVAGSDRAALISTRSVPAAAAPAVKLRLSFVNAETGAIRSHWMFAVSDVFVNAGPPLLRPVRPQPPLCGRPDGASFAIPVVADDGSDQVMVVQADGSGARAVARGVMAFWSPPLPR